MILHEACPPRSSAFATCSSWVRSRCPRLRILPTWRIMPPLILQSPTQIWTRSGIWNALPITARSASSLYSAANRWPDHIRPVRKSRPVPHLRDGAILQLQLPLPELFDHFSGQADMGMLLRQLAAQMPAGLSKLGFLDGDLVAAVEFADESHEKRVRKHPGL